MGAPTSWKPRTLRFSIWKEKTPPARCCVSFTGCQFCHLNSGSGNLSRPAFVVGLHLGNSIEFRRSVVELYAGWLTSHRCHRILHEKTSNTLASKDIPLLHTISFTSRGLITARGASVTIPLWYQSSVPPDRSSYVSLHSRVSKQKSDEWILTSYRL